LCDPDERIIKKEGQEVVLYAHPQVIANGMQAGIFPELRETDRDENT